MSRIPITNIVNEDGGIYLLVNFSKQYGLGISGTPEILYNPTTSHPTNENTHQADAKTQTDKQITLPWIEKKNWETPKNQTQDRMNDQTGKKNKK